MLDTHPGQVPASATDSKIGLNGSFSSELETLRADLSRLLDQQKELMQLLGTKRPDKLVHDVRNLLQERMFLEAACKRFGG